MDIGVCGLGVVGGALAQWLEVHTTHNLKIYDPPKGYTDSLKKCDATFIAVPVPTNKDGTQDYSILEEVRERAVGEVFIRSTVLPGTNDDFETWSCPEFLTERTAYKDTCEMGILTGCPDKQLMHDIFPGKLLLQMSNVECELAKYAHNAFGAVKVNFFNIIYDICKQVDARYAEVLKGVLLSGYINETHSKVPGPDGLLGFGGTCFPKDLKAFNEMFNYKTFEACLDENNNFRVKSNLN